MQCCEGQLLQEEGRERGGGRGTSEATAGRQQKASGREVDEIPGLGIRGYVGEVKTGGIGGEGRG